MIVRLLLGSALLTALPVQEQPPSSVDLGGLVEAARRAFVERRFSRLFDDKDPVRLELPNQPAAVSVRGRVAAASLEGLVRRTSDLAIEGVGAAVVAPGHGYIELRRVFRAVGTEERHAQRILLGARQAAGTWKIAEVWVAPSVVVQR